MKQSNTKRHYPKSIYPIKTKLYTTSILVVILILYTGSMYWIQNDVVGDVGNAFTNMGTVIKKFFPPNFNILVNVWKPLLLTIEMAIIATTIATILAIPLTLLSSKNLVASQLIYYVTRTALNILRTIPGLLLAVIFIGLFGAGVFSGIVALIIFSLCILAKLTSEMLEGINMEPLEAVRAAGGNYVQVIVKAVMPQVLAQFLSYILFVFEINIRASVILGLVGAGGIGRVLDRELGFYNYPNVMAIIIVIIMIVMLIEWMNNRLREVFI